MIGMGTPISQSSTPLPNPMSMSSVWPAPAPAHAQTFVGQKRSARGLSASESLQRRLPEQKDRGAVGGFKWSSQHLDGSCDEHSKTALGSFWAGAVVLTRSTAGGRARGAAAILGSDCGGHGE